VPAAAAARAREQRGRDRLRRGERGDLVTGELADRARLRAPAGRSGAAAPSRCTAAMPEKVWITLS
jgi:hypothetical protein